MKLKKNVFPDHPLLAEYSHRSVRAEPNTSHRDTSARGRDAKRFMNKRFQSYALRYEIPRRKSISPENRKKHSETLSPVRKAKAPTSLSNTHTKNNGLCQKCKETQSHTRTNHSGCVKQLCNSVHKTLTAAYGAASHHVQNHLFSVSKLFRIGPPGARHA